MVRDVDNRDIRINLQDHAFQRPDQVVVRSVVRRQRNNLVSQWSLSAWAFCKNRAPLGAEIAYLQAKGPLAEGQQSSARLLRNH